MMGRQACESGLAEAAATRCFNNKNVPLVELYGGGAVEFLYRSIGSLDAIRTRFVLARRRQVRTAESRR